MDSRPIIGIPTQTLQSIEVIPEGLPLSWVMNHRYYVAVAQVGGAPFMIPLLEDEEALRALYERMDALFIAGGVDMDPASYGDARHELCGRTDPRATGWSSSSPAGRWRRGSRSWASAAACRCSTSPWAATSSRTARRSTRAPSSTTTSPGRATPATTWPTPSRWRRAPGCASWRAPGRCR